MLAYAILYNLLITEDDFEIKQFPSDAIEIFTEAQKCLEE